MAIPCRLHAQSTPTSLGAHWEPHPHWLQLWGEVKRNYLFLSNLEFLKTSFFSFGGIGVWTRGFVLAKQILYTWAMSPLAICDLVIFETGPHIYAQAGLDCDLPTYVSCVAGMVHGHSYAQPLVGMEVWKFFFPGWLWTVLSSKSLPSKLLRLQVWATTPGSYKHFHTCRNNWRIGYYTSIDCTPRSNVMPCLCVLFSQINIFLLV
jgi:hypothetical protein